MDELNVTEFLECLAEYKAFKKPVSLETAVEVLNVLWEDEDM